MTGATLGIGFVGAGWMARSHAHALHTIQHLPDPPARTRLAVLGGRRREPTEALAGELGFERAVTDWREVVESGDVDVVACLGPPDVHAGPAIAALELGKPVLSEKPLAATAAEAARMRDAARAAGVAEACGFNYRFVPAVRLARDLLADGRLGRPRHARLGYLQDWAASPEMPRTWRFERRAGSGAVGDYSHIIDLVRYLIGEPEVVHAATARFVDQRPAPDGSGALLPVEVEDAYWASVRVGEAVVSLEASRCATGWKGRQLLEVYGEQGALWWDLEDLNRLHVALVDDQRDGLGGFRDVLVTEPDHPYMELWWAPGHILGWEHTFVHQWRDFLRTVVGDGPASPHQATFTDGERAVAIGETILDSAQAGHAVEVPPG